MGTIGVAGGAVRSESVRLALAAAGGGAIRSSCTTPRGRCSQSSWSSACWRRSRSRTGVGSRAIAAAPVTDTVKRAGSDGLVRETLERSELWAVQTPQVFRRAALEHALDVPDEVLAQATDDAWLVERAGGSVVVVPAPRENLKITTHGSTSGDRSELLSRASGRFESRGRCSPTTTSICAPTGVTRPPPSYTSRAPTSSATAKSRPRERGIAELGVSEHVYRFQQALDVWQHPFWREHAIDDLGAYCEFVRERTDLKLGHRGRLRTGHRGPDGQPAWKRTTSTTSLGSVHFLRDESLDMDEYGIWSSGRSAEEIWRRYFQTLGEAARSGLFDILAHPDLVKVWGAERPRPEGDLRRYYELAVEGIAESGIAVEVSTAGLRKRTQELYPAPQLTRDVPRSRRARRALERRAPPADVGADYERGPRVARAQWASPSWRVRARSRRLGADRRGARDEPLSVGSATTVTGSRRADR